MRTHVGLVSDRSNKMGLRVCKTNYMFETSAMNLFTSLHRPKFEELHINSWLFGHKSTTMVACNVGTRTHVGSVFDQSNRMVDEFGKPTRMFDISAINLYASLSQLKAKGLSTVWGLLDLMVEQANPITLVS